MHTQWNKIYYIAGICILCTGCFHYRFKYDQWPSINELIPSEENPEIPEDFNYEQLIEVFNPCNTIPVRQITEPEAIMEYTHMWMNASKEPVNSLPDDIETLVVVDSYATTDEYYVNKGYEPITYSKETLFKAGDIYYFQFEDIVPSTPYNTCIYQTDESFASYLLGLCDGEYNIRDKKEIFESWGINK